MRFVSQSQLTEALRQLAAFRTTVNKQAAQHILSFLALRRKGVDSTRRTVYQEKDGLRFFRRFAKIDGSETPYFDPIGGLMRSPRTPTQTLRRLVRVRSFTLGAPVNTIQMSKVPTAGGSHRAISRF